MEKSDNFFVISNYNTDPHEITNWARDYLVYDQSDNPEILKLIADRADPRVISSKHTGHNLIDYFNFIVENYQNLPERVAFIKGNIIGRHVTEDFWQRNYRNEWFTFLWSDPRFNDKEGIAYALYSGKFVERNNSWYVPHSTHRYFNSLNGLLNFFYDLVQFPEFNLFSPGACYILEKERILRNPVSFYKGLIKIMDYGFFPSEAWMVERIMGVIFDSDYQLRSYVYSEPELFKEIAKLPDLSGWQPPIRKLSRIRLSLIYRTDCFIKYLKK